MEEKRFGDGLNSQENIGDNDHALEGIKDYLLRIETLEKNKEKLSEELKEKEQKWIEDDRVFKMRRELLQSFMNKQT